MRYLTTVLALSSFMTGCGVGDVDYDAPVQPVPVTDLGDMGAVMTDVVAGLNTACGTQILTYTSVVVSADTVVAVQDTAWLATKGSQYIGWCDNEDGQTGNCRTIHVMDFIQPTPVDTEYLTMPQAHRVLTHELGHALGLGHNTKTNDIMNADVPDDAHMTPEQGYASLVADLQQYLGLCD